MPQIKNPLTEARIPFAKMSFTPDVPSTALGPNEYNDGLNIETDVRGIRSTAGDLPILDFVPGTPTFISSGFRADGDFWFIVATTEGYWWASNGGAWQDITPPALSPIPGYAQNTNITEAWNGTVPFFNDTINPPMFWLDGEATMRVYSNTNPVSIASGGITAGPTTTTRTVTFATAQPSAPFATGDKIQIQYSDPRYYDGVWEVYACTTTTCDIICSVTNTYGTSEAGQIQPAYTWNYNPNWSSVSAYFMRLYNAPNVGSILVAGNLTAVPVADPTTTEVYPVTVQWSQNFGLNQAPATWEPTVTNVANQLEVPLRGPALDAFPCNGQLFLCSYWDTVVFSPINYSTTSAPILGVRLFNQGRGLLSSNCWANTDKLVYGIDARDVWVFDGQDFTGLGNQRVKNWFFDQLDPQYYDRVFMEVNTQKNQVEIYYPDSDATGGVPNKMISYRYDLEVWNAPRDVSDATFSCESPIWTFDTGWSTNNGSRTVVYARGVEDVPVVQKDYGYAFIDPADGTVSDQPISSYFRRDNIKLLPDYSGKLMVHRILPEAVNLGAVPFTGSDHLPITPSPGNITVTIEGANSVGSTPIAKTPVTIPLDADGSYNLNPWAQINQNAFRVNSIELSNTSNADVWMCSATTWQFTQVEDDR